MSIRSCSRLLILTISIALALPSQAVAAAPTLNHLFPAGGQRGSKVIVECSGTFTWPVKVFAPGVEVVAAADSGKLEVTIPNQLMTDRIWIRLYDSEGASAAMPFLIGSLPEINEIEPNDRPQKSQQIEQSEITINGLLKDADVDCFSVRLTAGQTLVAAVDANTKLGSPMDAILQVVAENGIVVAENHDDLKLDPRLAFTPSKDGIYTIRLFSFPSAPNTTIRFSGGANFVYRLTLTTGPLTTHSIPLSTSLTSPQPVGIAGWNISPTTKLNVVPFGGGQINEQMEFEVQDDLRRTSDARIGFAYSPDFRYVTRCRLTNQMVIDAASTPRTVDVVPIPISASVTGCIRSRKQTDQYQISLIKDQSVVITVESRSLDLPLDPVLKLIAANGSVVTEVDDTAGTRDAAVAFTPPQDGDYRIIVTDRFSQGNERGWYLLTVRPDEPDFELSATSDTIVVAPDKPTELTIKILRRGIPANQIGPITIEPTGLPVGVTAAPVVSEPNGPTSTEVKLSFAAADVAFNGPIQIIGKTSLPKEFVRTAKTSPRLGVSFETIWLTATAKR